MQSWQERVIEEKKELDEKIKKLDAFLGSDDYYNLFYQSERMMLNDQKYFMDGYSRVLGQRISNFEDES